MSTARTSSPPDWTEKRERMVRVQILGRGLCDRTVVDAVGRVLRHEFVPDNVRFMAYDDCPLPIGHGQTLSQPYMVALMTEALGVGRGDRVLEVGTGSGYQAAVLAEVGCRVDTVERDPALARSAAERLRRLGYEQVCCHLGDGSLGWLGGAPYRAIVVTAGGPRVPPSLERQLAASEGCLVMPVGDRALQELVRVIRTPNGSRIDRLGGCRFVPLVGEEGW